MLRFTASAAALLSLCAAAWATSEPPHSAAIDAAIAREARLHGVPERLVRRIVMRESKFNPRARNHSFWGLMQISYPTARSMGFRGTPRELLDPVVNLTYAVPYLANAFIIAGRQEDAAVRLYASGYYETAKNRNMLDRLRTAESAPVAPDDNILTATARPVANLVTAMVQTPQAVQQRPQPEPPQVAGTVGGGSDTDPEYMMISGKKGLEPPKKWQKDGGVTLVGRGEQPADQIAAYAAATGTEPADKPHKQAHARHKSHKNTDFASLDAPPASAQAYAADPRYAAQQQPGQAAISQATAGAGQPELRYQAQYEGQPQGQSPQGQAQAAAPGQLAPAGQDQVAAGEPTEPSEPKKLHHGRSHGHKAAKTGADAPTAKEAGLRSSTAADGTDAASDTSQEKPASRAAAHAHAAHAARKAHDLAVARSEAAGAASSAKDAPQPAQK